MQKNTKPLSGRVALSARLEAIADLAGRGRTVCDVGCDHAHIPIRLLQTGSYENAIGMDVIDGPLGKAAGNLALYGMTDRVELRLSDGLDAFRAGEADTLVITGMGGTMMENILLREPDKTRSFAALVLGPQSDPDKVRAALRRLGFEIRDERLIYEDGKYYPVLRAGHQGQKDCDASDSAAAGLDDLRREAEDLFGPVLLQRQDPVLYEFLTRQTRILEKIHASISTALKQRGGETSQRQDRSSEDRAEECSASGRPQAKAGAEQLRDRHLARQKEIEHSLQVFRAGMSYFSPLPGEKEP